MKVDASVNGKALTLDPIRTIPVTIEINQVESLIPCGFRQVWTSGDVDGLPLECFTGAGLGSPWLSIQFNGKDYCVSIEKILLAFVEAVDS